MAEEIDAVRTAPQDCWHRVVSYHIHHLSTNTLASPATAQADTGSRGTEVEQRTAPYLPDLIRDDVIMWASDFPHERERDQFGGDLPHLYARKDLSDEFKQKMLYDNPVRFYRFSEGDIAAAKKAK